MLECKKIGYAASHCAIAGILAFGATFVQKSGTVVKICLVVGGVFAALFAGNIAIYYAVGAIGEARKMLAWKVKALQAVSMALYTTAVMVTAIALGAISGGVVIGAAIASALIIGLTAYLAYHQRKKEPNLIMNNALPTCFTDIFSLDTGIETEIAAAQKQMAEKYFLENRDRITTIAIILAMSPQLYTRVMATMHPWDRMGVFHIHRLMRSEAWIGNAGNPPADAEDAELSRVLNSSLQIIPRPPATPLNKPIGMCLLAQMKAAAIALANPTKASNIRHYKKDDIECMVHEPYDAVLKLGVFQLIHNSKVDGDKVTLPGDSVVLTPENSFVVNGGIDLRNSIIKIKKNLETHAIHQGIITLQLTGGTLSQDQQKNNSKPLKDLYESIVTLIEPINQTLINAFAVRPEDKVPWHEAFMLEVNENPAPV